MCCRFTAFMVDLHQLSVIIFIFNNVTLFIVTLSLLLVVKNLRLCNNHLIESVR